MVGTIGGIMQNVVEIKPKKSFLNYINVFRGLAILLIIMGHTMQVGTSGSLLHKINCEIVCGGTALFIFISGFLFQHLSGKFEYKNYLSKKWTNVVLPYIITAIPGLLFCFLYPVAYKNTFEGLNTFLQIPILLSIGRVHNTPTWFIPMIILFFVCSWGLLKLEKKGILYKLLPILFVVSIIFQRGNIEYETLVGLSYSAKYTAYLKYIFMGFVHFFSLYVFGMFCSKYKEVIDKFYDKRIFIWAGMLLTAVGDIWLSRMQIYTNFTISKTFLTMLILGYLKHYDNVLIAHRKVNKVLDVIAKYSFGLFFVHWYWFFIYNQIFHLQTVLPVVSGNYFVVVLSSFARFLAVTGLSMFSLFVAKKLILKINKNANTRMFLGI